MYSPLSIVVMALIANSLIMSGNGNYMDKYCSERMEDKLKFATIDNFIGPNVWDKYDDDYRRQLMNNLVPLLHHRSIQSSTSSVQSNLTSSDLYIVDVLKSDLFAQDLFEDSEQGTNCSQRVEKSLQLFVPFVSKLSTYIDSLNGSTCGLFIGKLKPYLLEVSNLTNSEWLALPIQIKRKLASFIFPLMNVQAHKTNNVVYSKLDQAWKEVARNDLFLGDIYVDVLFTIEANGTGKWNIGNITDQQPRAKSDSWRTCIWIILCVIVSIAIYMALRFLNILPAIV
ncbi:hypothetical protein RDWZM_006255 [Blomia tropicalis]|uniref:Uncharacterized protein n=1 Tax=Blomia tropicalis TaxID=40697 RepID=A0A9Q0M5S5_BLOTA|nr:hypothetical protein RDWZM_006255 [Blomia tropicalis]